MAYASEHAGNSDLFVQTIGESTPRQLTVSTAEDSQPDWSPDGESLVFRSEAEGGGLFVLSARGGTPRKIAPFGYRPHWSPSGRLILFSSSGHQGGIPRFHLVALDGRPPVRLRPDILERFRPAYVAWRPDGQSVSIWGRQPDDRRAFLTASIREGTPTESSIDPAVETRRREADLRLDRFMWSPSGKYLYLRERRRGPPASGESRSIRRRSPGSMGPIA